MADETYYVNTAAVGTGDGSTEANGYTTLLAAFTARGRTVSAPDITTFICSGVEDEVQGAVSIKLADFGWAGDGEILLQGDLTSSTTVDETKYSWKLSNVGKPFYVDGAPTIRLKNFRLNAPRGGDAYMFYSLTTAAMPSIHAEDSILQSNEEFDQNLSIVRCGSVEAFDPSATFTFTDTTFLGYIGSAIYANYSSGCVSTFTRCTMKTGKFVAITDGGVHTAIDCAIEKTDTRDYFTGSPTITNCATSDGVGTNPLTIADWTIQFTDRSNGDVTLSQSSSLFAQGSTGNNIGSDQTTASTNISAFTSIKAGATILQTDQAIALVFQDYTDPIVSLLINDVDHSDLLSSITTTSATLDYVRKTADVEGTETVNIVLSDGTISRALLQDVTVTHPISAAYGLVDSNSALAGVTVTNADACFKVTTDPTHGTLDWTLPSSSDIDAIYTPEFGYSGTDFFVIEVYDPGTNATNSGQVDLTVSADTDKPTFLAGPTVSAITANTCSVGFTPSETGTYRIVCVTDGETAPTAVQVRAGQATGNATPLYDSGFQSMSASTPLIFSVIGLIAGTAYDMYVVLVDASSNDQLSTVNDFTTTGVTPVDTTAPAFTVDAVSSSPTENSGTISFTPDETGSYRIVCIPSLSGSEPSADHVLAGTDASDILVDARTALTPMTAGNSVSVNFTNLDSSTTYSCYVALVDAVNNKSISSVVALVTSVAVSLPSVAKFTGTFRDWDTNAVAASLSGLKVVISETFEGDKIGTVATFSTDASGVFSVDYPGATIGTEYFCMISDSAGTTTELHMLTAVTQ